MTAGNSVLIMVISTVGNVNHGGRRIAISSMQYKLCYDIIASPFSVVLVVPVILSVSIQDTATAWNQSKLLPEFKKPKGDKIIRVTIQEIMA